MDAIHRTYLFLINKGVAKDAFPIHVTRNGQFISMKRLQLLLLVVIALPLAACSTTTYLHASGTGVQRGNGGSYRVVDGIEIYQEGTPNRPYQIIGVIEDSRPAGPWTLGPRANTVAKLALQNGGQAVVQQSDVRQFVGFSTSNNGNWNQYQNANWNQNRNGYNNNGQYANWGSGSSNRYTYGNANGNSTTTALYNAHARFLVIRYR